MHLGRHRIVPRHAHTHTLQAKTSKPPRNSAAKKWRVQKRRRAFRSGRMEDLVRPERQRPEQGGGNLACTM